MQHPPTHFFAPSRPFAVARTQPQTHALQYRSKASFHYFESASRALRWLAPDSNTPLRCLKEGTARSFLHNCTTPSPVCNLGNLKHNIQHRSVSCGTFLQAKLSLRNSLPDLHAAIDPTAAATVAVLMRNSYRS